MSDPGGSTRTRTGEGAGRRLDEHEREFRRLTDHTKEVFWIGDPERLLEEPLDARLRERSRRELPGRTLRRGIEPIGVE